MTATVTPPSRHAERPSAATYRRRRFVALVILLAAVAGGIYVPVTLFTAIEPVAAAVETPEPLTIDAAELDWASYGTAAVGVVELPAVFESRGTDEPRPLASITKLVTALTVLDAHPLDRGADGPTITMDASDVAEYSRYLALNGKVMNVAAGQQYSLHELLQIVLIESSNNHAASLASWGFGSEAAFLDAADDYLAQQGLTTIRLRDAAGIDPQNVGSTRDLIALGKLALANPVIADIVATKSVTVDYLGELDTTNILLGKDGVSGLKTGTLNGWGANLLFSAVLPVTEERSVTIVGVVLGAPTHAQLAEDVRRLIATARERVQLITLATSGQVVGEYQTVWGEKSSLTVAHDLEWLTWGDGTTHATVEASPLTTGGAGEPVGRLVFDASDASGAPLEVPLTLSETIDDPGPWWRLTHPGIVLGLEPPAAP